MAEEEDPNRAFNGENWELVYHTEREGSRAKRLKNFLVPSEWAASEYERLLTFIDDNSTEVLSMPLVHRIPFVIQKGKFFLFSDACGASFTQAVVHPDRPLPLDRYKAILNHAKGYSAKEVHKGNAGRDKRLGRSMEELFSTFDKPHDA